MTTEQHIENLKAIASDMPSDKCSDWIESLMAGVKALEQEPCDDAISRQELLKIYEDRFLELQKLKHLKDNKGAEDRQMGVNYCINVLKELSSVTPQQKMGR